MLFVCSSGQPKCPNIILYYIILYYIILTTTTQCKLLERKYGICASGWKEKHHQRKLQWVKPPRVHNAAIIVTCVRVHKSNFFHVLYKKFELYTLTQVTMIAALCTRGGFTHCNLRWWCFSFHPLAQIPYLRSSNLHCVVVVFRWWWWWWLNVSV